jgi:hypothetical protein
MKDLQPDFAVVRETSAYPYLSVAPYEDLSAVLSPGTASSPTSSRREGSTSESSEVAFEDYEFYLASLRRIS